MASTTALRMQTPFSKNTEYQKILERLWRTKLSPSEHTVVSFIYDRTHRFNKVWERIPYAHMLAGVVSRVGEVIHAGTGLSKSTLIRAVKSLVDKGYITREEVSYGHTTTYRYRINWGNSSMGLPVSRKRKAREDAQEAERVADPFQGDTPPVSERHPSRVRTTPHNNRILTTDQNDRRQERTSCASTQEDGQSTETTEGPVPETNPIAAVAAAAKQGTENTSDALKRKVKRNKANKFTSGQVYAHWKVEVAASWPEVRVLPWTPKEFGCAKNLANYIGDEALAFVAWCISNWHMVRVSKFTKGDRVKFPENPDFQFLFAFRKQFFEIWQERDFYQRMAGNPVAGLIIHLRRKGYTEDQATEIAEERNQQKAKLTEVERREAEVIQRERNLAHRTRYVLVNRGAGPVPSKEDSLASINARRRSTSVSTAHRPINTDISEW